jgi:hypothetical protein
MGVGKKTRHHQSSINIIKKIELATNYRKKQSRVRRLISSREASNGGAQPLPQESGRAKLTGFYSYS